MQPPARPRHELVVFGHAGAKVLVFPTRDGRFHKYEDLRLVESLRHRIEAGARNSPAWTASIPIVKAELRPAARVAGHG